MTTVSLSKDPAVSLCSPTEEVVVQGPKFRLLTHTPLTGYIAALAQTTLIIQALLCNCDIEQAGVLGAEVEAFRQIEGQFFNETPYAEPIIRGCFCTMDVDMIYSRKLMLLCKETRFCILYSKQQCSPGAGAEHAGW